MITANSSVAFVDPVISLAREMVTAERTHWSARPGSSEYRCATATLETLEPIYAAKVPTTARGAMVDLRAASERCQAALQSDSDWICGEYRARNSPFTYRRP